MVLEFSRFDGFFLLEVPGLIVSAPGLSGPGFEPWPETLCCVLEKDTSLLQ